MSADRRETDIGSPFSDLRNQQYGPAAPFVSPAEVILGELVSWVQILETTPPFLEDSSVHAAYRKSMSSVMGLQQRGSWPVAMLILKQFWGFKTVLGI